MQSLNVSRLTNLIRLALLSAFAVGALIGNDLKPRRAEVEIAAAEHETGDQPEAEEWFYEQRAYPLKQIPFGARARAVEQLAASEARQALARERLYGKATAAVIAQQSQPRWEAIGPRPIGPVNRANVGRTTAIALDPGYDGTINRTLYLGAAQGGVWKSTDDGANWTPLFDGQPTLAIGSLAIDPNNPNVIYAGTGEGHASADSYYGQGLFKSTDGGATWRQSSGPLSTIAPRVPAFQGNAIMDIAIDPRNSQTLFICTRNASAASAQNGGTTAGFAAGQRGVWKSTDGGETWRDVNPANLTVAYTASDAFIHPQDSSQVFVGIPTRGIYRSTTGGEPGTWERLTNGLPDTSFARIEMAVGPPATSGGAPTIYAVIADTNAFATNRLVGIYRTNDNGASWTRLPSQPNDIQGNYNLAIEVDAQNPNIIYVGMVSFYRSTDGGQSWQSQSAGNGNGNGGLHSDQHFAVVSRAKPNLLFVSNDGGAWRSDNANTPGAAIGWFNLNPTLNTVQFQSLALHPTDPNFVVGGTQDNGSNRFIGDAVWTRILGADGGYSYIDQSNPNIIVCSQQNSARSATANPSFGPFVSVNGGGSFTARRCGGNCQAVPGSMNPGDRVRFYSVLAGHAGFTQPNNVIYWGTQRIYRSPDLGVTWTGLGPSTDGFGQDLSRGASTVTAIAAHPKLDTATDPPGEIVWVATGDGNIQVTTNAGRLGDAVFTRADKAPLPNRVPVEIALDPNDVRRAYVVYSGFNAATPTTPGHVFTTEDLGATWRDISGDLPDVPVTTIAVDPMQSGTLFIGTDIGVFQTTDGGATWVRLGNGMPRVATFMLRLQAPTRTLVAATHGRGMFRLRLAQAAVTVSAANFRRESLTVEGIASVFGTALAVRTEVASTLPLPTSLAGTTVRITDANGGERLASLFFVSPQQINYQIPPDTAPGAVTVTITNGDGAVSFGIERVRAFAPGLFSANGTGRGVASGVGVRVRNGGQTFFAIAQPDTTATPVQQVPIPIDLGPEGDVVVLVLFGTGLRRRPDLSGVEVSIGGVRVPADYAGETPGLIGLDQVNFILPRSLAGRGDVDVTLNASGAATNVVSVRIR